MRPGAFKTVSLLQHISSWCPSYSLSLSTILYLPLSLSFSQRETLELTFWQRFRSRTLPRERPLKVLLRIPVSAFPRYTVSFSHSSSYSFRRKLRNSFFWTKSHFCSFFLKSNYWSGRFKVPFCLIIRIFDKIYFI